MISTCDVFLNDLSLMKGYLYIFLYTCLDYIYQKIKHIEKYIIIHIYFHIFSIILSHRGSFVVTRSVSSLNTKYSKTFKSNYPNED